MKTTLFFYFLFFGFIGYSQVNTKIIEVDLGTPHKHSIRVCKDAVCDLVKTRWLSVKSKDMVSIRLINGDSSKYTYKIDTKSISLFNDTDGNKFKGAIADAERGMYSNNKMPRTIEDIFKESDSLSVVISSLDSKLLDFNKQEMLDSGVYVEKKDSLLESAKENYGLNNKLLSQLNQFKYDRKYAQVEKKINETKGKAENSIREVIQYFDTVNSNAYTLPIDLQGKNIDVLEFKIRRFDKKTNEEDTKFAPNPYNVWIKNGLKIDVSAGLFVTSLFDDEFDKRDDTSISGNKIITLKNKGDYDLAIGTTINTYIRMNSWIVPTINFGAAFTQNEKIQIMLGGGVILGKQERIIFTAGLTMGKVTRIADSYSVGGSYNLGSSGDVPTQSQFKFGHFFGITYNLSKVKKISLDKGIEQN